MAADVTLASLLEEARGLLPAAVSLRRRIHQNPELGLDLPLTTAAVLGELDGLGLAVARSTATSGLVATLRGACPGPALLLRADMDALPMPENTGVEFSSREAGRMHACGHDSHTAMLVQAAHLLHRHREDLCGTVHLLFQPGEEGFFGARIMAEEGLWDGEASPTAAFAIHIDPRLAVGCVATRPGPLMAAADVWMVDVKGKGGHASMPHHTIDPVPIACEIVQALQTFVTRRFDAFDPVVISATRIEAGTTNNVIAESAHIEGTLRSTSERARERAHVGIRRLATQIAAAHEAEAEVQIFQGYPVTVNDGGFVGFTRAVTTELLGPAAFHEMPAPIMSAEDFSYILQRMPGALVFLGVRPEGKGPAAPCHSNRMILNEEGMVAGIALHAAIALRYLESTR